MGASKQHSQENLHRLAWKTLDQSLPHQLQSLLGPAVHRSLGHNIERIAHLLKQEQPGLERVLPLNRLILHSVGQKICVQVQPGHYT